MTIAAVVGQAGKANTSPGTSVSRAFGSNVSVGDLIVVCCAKYNTSDDPFIAADCTKSAGTATIGTVSLDKAFSQDDGAAFLNVGIWSAVVTGAGSLTMQVGGALANTYLAMFSDEYTGSFDSGRAVATNAAGSGGDGETAASSGNATLTGAGMFIGVLALDAGDAGFTMTEDAAWTQVASEGDGTTNEVAEMIRRIVSVGTTDDASWTIGAANLGWAAAVVAYKEVVGAVTPNAGSLGLTGNAPVVTQQAIRIPVTGALLLTGAVVAVLGSGLSQPNSGALALTGNAPIVTQQITIRPNAGALSLTGAQANVGSPGFITPITGSLGLTGFAASQTLTLDPPLAGALALTGFAPTVLVLQTRAPNAGALSLSGVAPVVTQQILRTPLAGSLALTGAASSVFGLAITIRPNTGSLVFDGNMPSINVPLVLAPQTGSLGLNGLAPTIVLSSPVITPATGTLSFTGYAPIGFGAGGAGARGPGISSTGISGAGIGGAGISSGGISA